MSIKKELLHIASLLIIIFVTKLSGNTILHSILASIIALRVLFSKDIKFWVVFTFLYTTNTAGLFNNYTFGIDIGPLIIDFSQLLFISLFFKTISKKRTNLGNIGKWLILLGFVVVVNVINGLTVGIPDLRILFRIVKLILPFLYIPIFYKVIIYEEDFVYFFKLIFPFVFIAFVAQIFVYIAGTSPAYYFFGSENANLHLSTSFSNFDNQLSRYVFSVTLLSVSLMGAFYYSSTRNSEFNVNYLYVIIFVVFFSFMLSATRSWTFGTGGAILVWLFLNSISIKKLLQLALLSFVLVFLIVNYVPKVKSQIFLASERLATVEAIADGDITAGGTASRFDIRAPLVMNAFAKTNIVFGAGYSEFYFQNADGHVGQHNLLLQSGILGSVVVNFFLLFLLYSNISMFLSSSTRYRGAYLAISLVLISLITVNFSVQLFSFAVKPDRATMYGVLVGFALFLQTEYRKSWV